MKGKIIFVVILLLFPPLPGVAATLKIDCDAGDTIRDALTKVKPADTILVSGTCNHHGFARILDTRIEGNRGAGIVVNENSVARVGFTIPRAAKVSSNTIENQNSFERYIAAIRSVWGDGKSPELPLKVKALMEGLLGTTTRDESWMAHLIKFGRRSHGTGDRVSVSELRSG